MAVGPLLGELGELGWVSGEGGDGERRGQEGPLRGGGILLLPVCP